MQPLIVCLVLLLMAGGAAEAKTQRSAAVAREFQRLHPCPATGSLRGACPGYVRDHVVPLCAGGADAVGNMQWQTVKDGKAKDRVERRMCGR
jgi:hypothetical protein